MSDFFDWLGDWCPLIFWGPIWLLVFPVRLFLLILLPANSKHWAHPMSNLYQFLAFDR